MKQELLVLIDQIDEIRKLAHSEFGSFPLDFVLYDVDEFVDWKQKIKFELIAIPNPDQYIADTLKLVNAEYNGFEDKHLFRELSGALGAIKLNIDRYYAVNSCVVEASGNKVFYRPRTR